MQKTFETSLQELENIVRQLEAGDLPLEESLKLFERGVQVSRECRERLNQAERRIEILMKDADGNASLREIEPESLREERKPANSKRIVFEDDDQPF